MNMNPQSTLRVATSVAFFTLLTVGLSAQAGDNAVSREIPPVAIGTKANIYYCDALVGSVIQGWTKKADEEFPDFSKDRPRPGNMQASAVRPTDRVVFVVESDQKTLTMSSRKDFESGGSAAAAPAPLNILEMDDNFIVAFGDGAAGPSSSSLVTIDRKRGLGTWTITIARDIISGLPRIDTMALSCGSRRP
jgi:hypothetical protein